MVKEVPTREAYHNPSRTWFDGSILVGCIRRFSLPVTFSENPVLPTFLWGDFESPVGHCEIQILKPEGALNTKITLLQDSQLSEYCAGLLRAHGPGPCTITPMIDITSMNLVIAISVNPGAWKTRC